MASRVLSAQGAALLQQLIPEHRTSRDMQAAVDVIAREVARLDAARDRVHRAALITDADGFLAPYNDALGLTDNKPVDQQISSILAFLRPLATAGSGADWETNLTRLIGTQWTYDESTSSNGVPKYTVRIQFPFGAAVLSPTGLTATPSTTGGTLTAGTRRYAVTAVNSVGETLISNIATATTTGTTSKTALAWTAPAANGQTLTYRIYRDDGAGFLLLASGVSGASYTDTGTALGQSAPPSTNTTKSLQAYEAEALVRRITPSHIDLIFRYQQGFLVGVSRMGEVL